MDHTIVRQQLLDYLVAKTARGATVPEALVAAVASSRPLIAELDAISSVLTGEPSMLKAQSDQLLTCDECLALLGAYVEDRVAGVDVATHYPTVAAHLERCPACQEQANLVYELLQGDAQGANEVTPAYLTFETWFQGQAARRPAETQGQGKDELAPVITPVITPMAGLWEQVSQKVHRLSAEVAVVLQGGKILFGNLADGLTPQARPAPAYRNTPLAGGEFAEFLELPHAEANLAVKVRLGPVVESAGTLVIEIGSITPPQPMPRVRVTLRDDEGSLLEAAQSDADGFVIFGHLEVGKYQVEIEHADQAWVFGITLNAV
jgi:hypothetical protein